jgi:REP element-mobilizing transposase RayT
VYHITARGNDRQTVFCDVPDRQVFLWIMHRVVRRHAWSCLSYCLLDNHYHLLVGADRLTLGDGMRTLNGRYAEHVNRRRRRTGHVWEGRFHSVPVYRHAHVLEAMRYLALNPVRASLCPKPEQWTWSAHRALAGLCRSDIVDVDAALSHFHPDPRLGRAAYRRFLGVAPDPDACEECRCEPPRPSIESILGRLPRDRAVATARLDFGYSAREIAEAMGCHFTSVMRWARAGEALLRGQSP